MKDGGPPRERAGRIWVEEDGRRRPFMRGILVHSLMSRGVSFEDAYGAANSLRERFRGHEVITPAEITKAIRELLGDEAAQDRPPRPVEIRVVGAGEELPFSKGILSQSLLAAALDENEAFDVAREIEAELLTRGVREIERTDLRELTYEMLLEAGRRKAAERYLVWRRYQEPERPVMILLGGAAGVGKSSLALEVAHRLGIGRVISTDSIRQVMRIMLSKDLMPAIHASSYDAYQTLSPESLGEDPVIDGFRAQAETVSVGVRASMDRAVSENTSLVLEGVSLLPGLVDPESYEGLADVFFLTVAALDEGALANRFAARASGASRRTVGRYVENLDAILRIQDHILELSDRHDVPIVDNVSFDRSVLFIVRHVTESLRKREDPGDAE